MAPRQAAGSRLERMLQLKMPELSFSKDKKERVEIVKDKVREKVVGTKYNLSQPH